MILTGRKQNGMSFCIQDLLPANIAIESALMTRTSAAISFNPTGSRRMAALLKTPTTGMARVLMAATLAGKMRTRLKYAQWQ